MSEQHEYAGKLRSAVSFLKSALSLVDEVGNQWRPDPLAGAPLLMNRNDIANAIAGLDRIATTLQTQSSVKADIVENFLEEKGDNE